MCTCADKRYYRSAMAGTTASAVLPPTGKRYCRFSPKRYYRCRDRYYRVRPSFSESVQLVPLPLFKFLAYALPFTPAFYGFCVWVQVVVAPTFVARMHLPRPNVGALITPGLSTLMMRFKQRLLLHHLQFVASLPDARPSQLLTKGSLLSSLQLR